MDIVVLRGLNPERISVVPNTPALALRADGHETAEGGAPFLVTHCSLVLRDQSGARRHAARAKLAMRTLSWEALAPRYMAALGVDSGGLVPEVVG